ncbi:hypothetical protein SAMN05444320_11351 [Streptoalloteichus hindustanus]|uniref:Uncharacterized protein n=1 Tax=Streptoalloteichus hindustanus TaxID=2017 RepID=A0A1M5MAF6_STRHI|nr:hypothetical protein SAMN05444320_11351 [Streptoalloteichus hindustanus]
MDLEPPEPLRTALTEADHASQTAAARIRHLRLLNVARLVRIRHPTATAVVVDVAHNPARGVRLVGTVDSAGTVLWPTPTPGSPPRNTAAPTPPWSHGSSTT